MQRSIARRTLSIAVAVWTLGLLASAGEPALETVHIPSAGGIELATDIYHPAVEPAPVILVRTPYGRGGIDYLATPLAAQGYVVAVQDVRGKYDSTGEHEPFRHERTDGLATLSWLAKQEWCDGNIGMWGSSYSGYAALAVADAELPAFRSIFSISGWLAVEEVVRPGGANHLMLNLAWMVTQQGRQQRSLSEFDVESLFRHTPMRDALRAAGIRSETWEDPAWMDDLSAVNIELGEIKRPVFQLTGWHDMVYRATLAAWGQVAAGKGQPHKLAIGPWYHNQFLFGSWEVGDADFGRASGMGTDEIVALSLEWFDATLRGRGDSILKRAPVTYFMMGQNAWHEDSAWPPAGARARHWYLGEGGLLTSKRPRASLSDTFRFDPNDPVPTVGGANFFYFPDKVGVRDQREVEERQDVLVYTSPPLDKGLQITGNVKAHLRVATSGEDTDFTAKLVVVRPDGYARIVEDGIVRVSRNVDPRPATGEPFDVEIDLGHTAIAVPRGDRLRLEVSSSNFPKYDRNPNTGEDAYLAARLSPATQTVFHGGKTPSWLELPVRRRPLEARAAQREPLIRPLDELTTAPPIEVAGQSAAELIATGRRQLEEGDAVTALASFKRAAELEPEQSDHHYWVARANLTRLNEVSMFKKLAFAKKVQASYLRAIELDPDNVQARSGLANFYFNAPGIAGGSTEKGMVQAAEVLERDAKEGHLLMAQAHLKRKDPAKAVEAYRAAIVADPADAMTRYRLGLLHHQEKQWDDAFAVLEAAVKETAEPLCLYQLGRTSVLSGLRLERGKAVFEQYIAEAKGTQVAHAHWRLGMVYEKLGQPDRAREAYETALRLDPEVEQAREALKNLGE